MSKSSQPLLEAIALLGQVPLPEDAEHRLRDLERLAPASEFEQFGDLWEALLAAQQTDINTPY